MKFLCNFKFEKILKRFFSKDEINLSIIKNGIIYLFSSVLSKSVPFLVLPIMTAYLSPEEYGKLSMFMVIISFYNAIVGMHLSVNIGRNYHKYSKKLLSILIGNMLFILFTSMLIYLLISYIIFLNYKFLFSIPAILLLLVPIICMFNMVNTFNTTILRFEQRASLYGLFEISFTTIKVGVTVIFLVLLGVGWYSQVVGVIVGGFVFFIIGLIYMYRKNYISFRYNPTIIKSILSISLPLIPHVLGGIVITMSDRFFIEQMLDLEAVGIYSVGYSIGMVMMLFTNAFIKSWSPWLYKQLVNPTESQKKQIVRYTYFYVLGVFILTIIITLGSNIILPYIVNEKYYGASKLIFWVALGYAFRGIYQIFLPYLVHINKTSFLAISTVIAAIVNLILNYFLIDIFGSIGAAYATIGAFATSAILVFWYQQKKYYMPWFKLSSLTD